MQGERRRSRLKSRIQKTLTAATLGQRKIVCLSHTQEAGIPNHSHTHATHLYLQQPHTSTLPCLVAQAFVKPRPNVHWSLEKGQRATRLLDSSPCLLVPREKKESSTYGGTTTTVTFGSSPAFVCLTLLLLSRVCPSCPRVHACTTCMSTADALVSKWEARDNAHSGWRRLQDLLRGAGRASAPSTRIPLCRMCPWSRHTGSGHCHHLGTRPVFHYSLAGGPASGMHAMCTEGCALHWMASSFAYRDTCLPAALIHMSYLATTRTDTQTHTHTTPPIPTHPHTLTGIGSSAPSVQHHRKPLHQLASTAPGQTTVPAYSSAPPPHTPHKQPCRSSGKHPWWSSP